MNVEADRSIALVMLELPRTGAAQDFAAACRARSVQPIVFVKRTADYPDYLVREVRQLGATLVRVDTGSLLACLRRCMDLQVHFRVAGIVSFNDYTVVDTARLSSHLGLPSPPVESLQLARDKRRFREYLLAQELDNVPVYSVVDVEAGRVRYPVVIKPVSMTGSALVALCHDRQQALCRLDEIAWMTRSPRTGGAAETPAVTIEGYIPGQEFSVEVLNGAVVAVVCKHTSPSRNFVELGHDAPAELAEPVRRHIVQRVTQLVKALSLEVGILHVEVKVDGGDVHFIEVNPRCAGDRIPELIKLATGVDMIGDLVERYATGRVRERTQIDAGKRASIRFLPADDDGYLAGYRPWKLDAEGAIAEIRLYHAVGRFYRLQHSNRDRIAYVISCTASVAANEEAIQATFRELAIEWRSAAASERTEGTQRVG